jgi:hypothetical protein
VNLHPNNAKTSIVDGRVVCEPTRKNVAIVGFGPTAMEVTKIQHDPDWEIWGLNDGYRNRCFWDAPLVYGDNALTSDDDAPRFNTLDLHAQPARLRVDRWFELHPMRVQPVDDVKWLAMCPVPVYLCRDLDREKSATVRAWPKSPDYAPLSLPAMPNAVTYPLAELEEQFKLPAPFWASTFAYQIALAISEGFTGIGLFGLDFGSEREVIFERGNALWWAGLACGRGISLAVPPRSTLLNHGARYGFQYDEEVAFCNGWIERYHQWWKLEQRQEPVGAR